MPLLPVQAAQLIAAAERAPYGRGDQTLVDTEVRRTWQIGAAQVRIAGKHWARMLEALTERAATGLGAGAGVHAELYKLLIYDAGSFFVSHRDTEKAPGMFATLIVALPSVHAGGELVVRHGGREVRLDLRCEDPSEAAFAAFYADCVHEVLPVKSGCRLVLAYNLLRKGRGRLPDRRITNPKPRRWRSCCTPGAKQKTRGMRKTQTMRKMPKTCRPIKTRPPSSSSHSSTPTPPRS